jgi:hypothetical protein
MAILRVSNLKDCSGFVTKFNLIKKTRLIVCEFEWIKLNAKLKVILSERERVRYRLHRNPHNNGNRNSILETHNHVCYKRQEITY